MTTTSPRLEERELVRPSIGATTRSGTRPRGATRVLRQSLGPLAVLALWQLTCSLHVFSSVEVASPLQVWHAGRELWGTGDLQHSLVVSLRRVVEGLALGVVAGLTLALLAGFFRLAEDLVNPVMQAARAIPLLGLLPLFVIWFGVGETSKVYLIAVGCVFPIYINTFGAIRHVDVKLVEAGRTFGLGRLGLIRTIILPGALPGFFIGLRFALIGSWLFVIVAEQINAQDGIGSLMSQAQIANRTDIIFLGLAVYAVLGVGTDLLVQLLERRFLSWRRTFEGD